MDTLLAESMVLISLLWLLGEAYRTAGNSAENGAQLELIEYHARFLRRVQEGLCGDSRPRLSAGRSPAAFFGEGPNGLCIVNRSSGTTKSGVLGELRGDLRAKSAPRPSTVEVFPLL